MVLAGAFSLAWWKLPEWQPSWVIDHSPFVEPTVRAMLASGFKDDAVGRALDWGAAIGPILRHRFADGTEIERWRVMGIARSLVKKGEELHGVTAIQDVFCWRSDGSLLSEADAVELRDHLRGLARDACASGGDYPSLAMDVMVAVYEPDFGPVLWKLAEDRLGQYDLSFVTDGIAHVRDPRAVGRLMPLFVAPVEKSDRTYLGGAMRDSLAKSQQAEVLAAMRHVHPRVRIWGVHAILLLDPDAEARVLLPALMTDPDPQVRIAALDVALFDPLTPELLAGLLACLRDSEAAVRTMSVKGAIVRKIPLELRAEVFAHLDDLEPNIRAMVIDAIGALRLVEGGPLLVDRLQREQERHLRPAILDALVAINHPERHAVLRQLAVTVDDSVRGAAIVLLGRLGDAADFSLLLHLLQDDDEDIARKARIALSYLPLTPQQQSQVDAIWDATEDDSESHSPAFRP